MYFSLKLPPGACRLSLKLPPPAGGIDSGMPNTPARFSRFGGAPARRAHAGSLPAGADKRGKQLLLLPAVPHHFRMPLDAQDKGLSCLFHSLDDPVI